MGYGSWQHPTIPAEVKAEALHLLFGFVVLRHDRRELVQVTVTDQPTAAWAAQQIVESFPEETTPKYLLRIAMPSTVTCSHGG